MINSVNPCQKYLTFGPWIYMVPQYDPASVLILGYGGGTVAGLIQLLYGDVPITGVDIVRYDDPYGVGPVQMDAREYLKTCGQFDTVVIDLFLDGKMCEFVCTQEFMESVKRIARYVIINTLGEPDMSVWKSLKCLGMNKPNRCSNLIYYYVVDETLNLLP